MGSGYSQGFGAVAEAAAKARSFSGPQSQMFGWKDKDQKFIRLLSDDVITIGFHNYVVGVNGKKLDYVCAAQLAGDKKRACLICDTFTYKNDEGEVKPMRPTNQTVGLAVFRKLQPKASGRGQELVDGLHKEPLKLMIDDKEQEFSGVPWIGVVKQSIGNFWSNFDAYFARYGTTIDRDYEVTRRGSGGGQSGTKYTVIPYDVDETLRVRDADGETDIEATKKLLDERYEAAMKFHPSLIEWVERMGSESRYEANLVGKPQETQPSYEEEQAAKTTAQPAAQETEANPAPETENATDFSSLRSSIQSYRSNS